MSWRFVLNLVISAGLLMVLFWINDDLSPAALRRFLIDPSTLLVVLTLWAQNMVGGLRWWFLIALFSEKLPPWPAWRMHQAGVFLSNMVPGLLGLDAYRMYTARARGVALAKGTQAVLLEKLMILLSACAIVALSSASGRLALAVMAVIAAILTIWQRRWPVLPIPTYLRAIMPAPTHPERQGRLVAGLVITSLLSLALLVAGLQLAWLQVTGAHPQPRQWMLFLAVILASSLPVSAGGWGLREAALVALFAGGNIAVDLLIATGVVYGLAQLVASLPGAAMIEAKGRPYPGAAPK
jgi:glycosyltransferase 2 family protein